MSVEATATTPVALPQETSTPTSHLSDYAAISQVLQMYIDGSRAGSSEIMRPAFYPGATLVGYVDGNLLFTPIQLLFDWIDGNGPATEIKPQIASIEILKTVAVARIEIEDWSGKNAGSGVHMSDLFNLVKTNEGWKVTQKLFHWHTR